MKIYHGQIKTANGQSDQVLDLNDYFFLWDRDMSFFLGGLNHWNETNMTRHIESMIDVEASSSTEFTTIYYTYYTVEMQYESITNTNSHGLEGASSSNYQILQVQTKGVQ